MRCNPLGTLKEKKAILDFVMKHLSILHSCGEKNLVEQIKLYVYSIKCAIESSSEPSSCSQEVDLASCICMTLGKILNPKLFSGASNGVWEHLEKSYYVNEVYCIKRFECSSCVENRYIRISPSTVRQCCLMGLYGYSAADVTGDRSVRGFTLCPESARHIPNG